MSFAGTLFQRAVEEIEHGADEIEIPCESKADQASLRVSLYREREKHRKLFVLDLIDQRIGIQQRDRDGKFYVVIFGIKSRFHDIVVRNLRTGEEKAMAEEKSDSIPPDVIRAVTLMKRDGLDAETMISLFPQEKRAGVQEAIKRLGYDS
jgi:hypothetical protein